ncbi:MAG: T9SS type A sorting domain-containing protein [Flavobacteriaceae bacterium]|nr:T9SS type A sorting domain-containing protein [Flavobacteriaceae bacterium]
MKKLYTLLTLLISISVFSQVSTVPSTPTANSQITITFNAIGTGLEDYSGAIYAHTGLITSESDSNSDWKNVLTQWNENIEKNKLTKIADNSYTFKISPSVFEFYNVPTTTTISSIAILFRTADGNKKNGPDIFIPLYQEGLNVVFTQPSPNSVYTLNDLVTINAEASLAATLELFIDGNSISTITNSTLLNTTHSFTTTGNHRLKIIATINGQRKEATTNIFIKSPTQNQQKPVGITYGTTINPDNSVSFLLKAPEKETVFLIGDFNNWQLDSAYQLAKDGIDFWLTIPNLDPNTEYAYQYLIDYEIKVCDPYSEKILDQWTDKYIKEGNYPNLKEYPNNFTEGYVSTFTINETPYTWAITDFKKPAQDNLIIYELHLRDFTKSDSFREAITKLDYLENLGINAIELMPINEFEGADSWGYNPALYMALDKAYGTKNDFKKFVDACHKRGIAVLADVVFNHSFGQSPMAQMYWNSNTNKPASNNPWYNVDHNLVDNTAAHWGSDFNHESPHTTAFFKDVLSYWMSEYKVDGFRFDFTKGMSNTKYYGSNNWASTYDQSRIDILKNYADYIWAQNPSNKAYVIFEHLADNSEEKVLANHGIMLWGNMNHNFNQNTQGYNNSTDISWISYKKRGWNNPTLVGYMESHDEERIMYKNLTYGNSSGDYNVKNLSTSLSRMETAGAFLFGIPGPKMIWQFGELGYDKSIDLDGRTSRKPVLWEYENDNARKQVYNTWATFAKFKQSLPAFTTDNFDLNVSGLTKSILLKHAEGDVLIVGNFDVTEKSFNVTFSKTGTWYEYFTGQEKVINTNTTQNITLKPGEYKMYSSLKLEDPRGGTSKDDSDGDGIVDTLDQCPNTYPGSTVNEHGCAIFNMPSNNFTVLVLGETCPEQYNGVITISSVLNYNFTTTIDGTPYDFTNHLTVENLDPGTYEFCIRINQYGYEQCFEVTVKAGTNLLGKVSLSKKSSTSTIKLQTGTAPYFIKINGKKLFETHETTFDIPVKHGDLIEVSSSKLCEGTLTQKIAIFNTLTAYPNPTENRITIAVPDTKKTSILVAIYNSQMQLMYQEQQPVIQQEITLDLVSFQKGLYFAKIALEITETVKIIKK